MKIKDQIIVHFLAKNYLLFKLISRFWFAAKFNQKDLLLVFQMGKVGSTTVTRSLRASNIDIPVLQVHFLAKDNLKEMEKVYYGERRSIFQSSLWPETHHLFLSHYLQSVRESNRWSACRFITMIRDPVARNVSQFFYSIDQSKHNSYLSDFYHRYDTGTISPNHLIERFIEVSQQDPDLYSTPLTWFEDELEPATGVDVFSTQFPKETGYQLYLGDAGNVLLLKLELLNECAPKAFKEFLGLDQFRLLSSNIASEKRYFPAYKKFMREVNLPRDYLSRFYESKTVRHFYTEEEISSFYQKWTK